MLRLLLAALLILAAPFAVGQDAGGLISQGDNPLSIPAITLSTDAQGQQEYSVSLQILLIMTALSFIPAFVMLMTSFTRIIIVFSILRQALGLQQTPSNQILVGLTIFLTLFIMAPVFTQAYQDGVEPLLSGQLSNQEAFSAAAQPVKTFMLAHTREEDLGLFLNISGEEPETAQDTPVHVVAPAFMISELRRAFEIGFLLFIPFLIIDLVVASILMSMGMMMLPPVIISLPFKLIFFVLVDGWSLVIGSLVQSFERMPPPG